MNNDGINALPARIGQIRQIRTTDSILERCVYMVIGSFNEGRYCIVVRYDLFEKQFIEDYLNDVIHDPIISDVKECPAES